MRNGWSISFVRGSRMPCCHPAGDTPWKVHDKISRKVNTLRTWLDKETQPSGSLRRDLHPTAGSHTHHEPLRKLAAILPASELAILGHRRDRVRPKSFHDTNQKCGCGYTWSLAIWTGVSQLAMGLPKFIELKPKLHDIFNRGFSWWVVRRSQAVLSDHWALPAKQINVNAKKCSHDQWSSSPVPANLKSNCECRFPGLAGSKESNSSCPTTTWGKAGTDNSIIIPIWPDIWEPDICSRHLQTTGVPRKTLVTSCENWRGPRSKTNSNWTPEHTAPPELVYPNSSHSFPHIAGGIHGSGNNKKAGTHPKQSN